MFKSKDMLFVMLFTHAKRAKDLQKDGRDDTEGGRVGAINLVTCFYLLYLAASHITLTLLSPSSGSSLHVYLFLFSTMLIHV